MVSSEGSPGRPQVSGRQASVLLGPQKSGLAALSRAHKAGGILGDWWRCLRSKKTTASGRVICSLKCKPRAGGQGPLARPSMICRMPLTAKGTVLPGFLSCL